MDPAAIKELQRLYAQKHKVKTERPTKRRKMSTQPEDRLTIKDVSRTSNELDEVEDSEFSDSKDRSSPDLTLSILEQDIVLPIVTSGETPIEVVTFDESAFNPTRMNASEGYKSFMSGKVPKTGIVEKPSSKKAADEDGEASDDEDDLKNDKELQRLLRESHLLHEQGTGSTETSGKIRQRAITEQLVSNGAAKAKQRKMPIGMRKGIEAAATKREVATDKYNKDNGIVTARKAAPVIKKKQNKTLHELNVGKYKNGKLTISRREIDRINGPPGGAKGKKKRGFRDFSNIG